MAARTAAERARAALLLAAAQAAGGSSPLAHRARGAWASQHIADGTPDGELVAPACDAASTQARYLAELPAVNAGGIALKLAQLVSQLLREFDGYPATVQNLVLASSALADAVVLSDGGPIELPIGAMEGVPDGDPRAAEGWLSRQEAMAGFSLRPDAATLQ